MTTSSTPMTRHHCMNMRDPGNPHARGDQGAGSRVAIGAAVAALSTASSRLASRTAARDSRC